MRAGKTAELIRCVRQAQVEGRKTQVFVHAFGVNLRGNILRSRNGSEIEAKPVRIVAEVHGADVVAVDEAHFWNEFDAWRLAELARHHDVIVAGLDTSFRGDPFPLMAYLLAIADSVTKLTAICARCGGQATRTQRLRADGTPAHYWDPLIVPGDEGMYEPR